MKNGVQTDDEWGSFWEDENEDYHRTDGPSIMDKGQPYEWHIRGERYTNSEEWRQAAGVSKEEMFALILKYGEIKPFNGDGAGERYW